MLTSLVFHLLFVIVIAVLGVFVLQQKSRINLLQKAVFFILVCKKIEYPKHRSQLVRSMLFLEHELAQQFNCHVKIEYRFFQDLSCETFFIPLCLFLNKNFENEKKIFVFEEAVLSAKEIFDKLNFISEEYIAKKKKITFIHSGKNTDLNWVVTCE